MSKQQLFAIIVIILSFSQPLFAEEGTKTVAYQMAYIHTQYLEPQNIVLEKKIKPETAVVTEFQWILDSMRYRCVNPPNAVANGIIQTWKIMHQNGQDLSLLDVARELSKLASNIAIFGREKVEFGTICQYWIGKKLGKTH